jgi:hypothetical protein
MKQTAVEWLVEQLPTIDKYDPYYADIINQAKEMEKKQLFLIYNSSGKDAYKAGQKTMNCGCYEISDATTYEEWLYEQYYNETYKSEQ